MKRCYLVRHAQSVWNVDNRIQGHSDLPLSPLGEQQAQLVGAWFAARHVRSVITSALRRSRQTAQAIVADRGPHVGPRVEAELAEIHLGSWEGLTPAELDAKFPGAYRQWTTAPSRVTIPGAEPLENFRRRVRGAFARVTERFEEGEHVVVTHGGVIASVLADVLGAEFDATLRRLRLDNTGVTALELGAAHPAVLWINATTHLASLGLDPVPLRQPGWASA